VSYRVRICKDRSEIVQSVKNKMPYDAAVANCQDVRCVYARIDRNSIMALGIQVFKMHLFEEIAKGTSTVELMGSLHLPVDLGHAARVRELMHGGVPAQVLDGTDRLESTVRCPQAS
jgi:hypothetical protein